MAILIFLEEVLRGCERRVLVLRSYRRFLGFIPENVPRILVLYVFPLCVAKPIDIKNLIVKHLHPNSHNVVLFKNEVGFRKLYPRAKEEERVLKG